MKRPTQPLALGEFVVLLALMISIVAMATDIMLPTLSVIGRDLEVAHANDVQLIVSSLFAGFALGQLIAGPLSDSYGRKPVIYWGYAVFMVGCLLSVVAADLTTMLIGRVLQGLGTAAPRVVLVSMVRDGYAGRAMARIMSIVMSVFILVPVAAPTIGQAIVNLSGWQATFLFLLIQAVVASLWFAFRQPETLAAENRRRFTIGAIVRGAAEALSNRTVAAYTLAAGFIFGAFLSYLSSAQQVFQVTFGTGDLFPLYFAVAALSLGLASFTNSRLVMRFGMHVLTHAALTGLTVLSGVFALVLLATGDVPPFALFLAWILSAFFCVGFLFGNLNALAMEPLGHMAGLGAALIGSASTFMSLPIGWFIAGRFDGGVLPLVSGFFASGLATLVVMRWCERMAPFGARKSR